MFEIREDYKKKLLEDVICKIDKLLKDEVEKIIIDFDYLKVSSKITKCEMISTIKKTFNEERAIDILEKYTFGKIGYTLNETIEILNLSKVEVKKLEKKKRLNVSGYYDVRAYGKYLSCPLYDIRQILSLKESEINELKGLIKAPTKKQLESLEKARTTAIKNRTCKKCGSVQGKKANLNDGICCNCIDDEIRLVAENEICSQRKMWKNNNLDFLIIDVETTGLGNDDEIIEIALIDIEGNILIDELVKPIKNIPIEATEINGIDNNMVANAPSFEKIYSTIKEIIKDKTILGFNVCFDINMINNTLSKYVSLKDEIVNNKFVDLMDQEMNMLNTDRYISLVNAVNMYEGEYVSQGHRALGDCYICLELINRSIKCWERRGCSG